MSLLTALCHRSALLAEQCVDSAEDESPARHRRARSAMGALMTYWQGACESVDAGEYAAALDLLESARQIAVDWGDDAPEREAIRIIRETQYHAA